VLDELRRAAAAPAEPAPAARVYSAAAL
jgi:hypothetical protein